MNYIAAKSIQCVLVVVLFSSLVSCERLTLDEEPHATSGTPTAGYPNVQSLINGALDEALVAVSNAAGRQASPDPGHTALTRVLRQARHSNLATARALDIDPEVLLS